MRIFVFLLFTLLLVIPSPVFATDCHLNVARSALVDVALTFELSGCSAEARIEADGEELTIAGGAGEIRFSNTGVHQLSLLDGDKREQIKLRVLSGFWSLVPPLIAIVLALLLRNVILALALSLWAGVALTSGDVFSSLLRVADTYAVKSIADSDHASIIIFSLTLGGMVGVIRTSGGGRGVAEWVRKRALTRRSAEMSTVGLGFLIFFDDYANSLLVGSAMRPIVEKLRISKEKLAFLVDATAAPVASLALISSWVGVEMGYIADEFAAVGIDIDGYQGFIATIPYRFYPLLMLVFVIMLAYTGADFGPMRRAEKSARNTEVKASDDADENGFAINALLPIVTVIVATSIGMYISGYSSLVAEGKNEILMRDVFAAANSYGALIWAAMAGSVAAIGSAIATRVFDLGQAMQAWLEGTHEIVIACIILVLAWALGSICRHELHTANYLVSLIGDSLSPHWLPAVVFVLSALISFATGTSWGTMAILFPIVVPLIHGLAPGQFHLLLGGVGAILSGSVWGDHCSPISDTTIMSSMATGCDHIAHVKTQLPYAMLVGALSLLVGEIPVGAGIYGPTTGLAIGVVFLVGFFLLRARKISVEEH